jgi:hypothetical protein
MASSMRRPAAFRNRAVTQGRVFPPQPHNDLAPGGLFGLQTAITWSPDGHHSGSSVSIIRWSKSSAASQ